MFWYHLSQKCNSGMYSVIISDNHRIHYTEKQNRNQTMYIKFLKSNEGKKKKGINRIKFVETHSKFFNTTELA